MADLAQCTVCHSFTLLDADGPVGVAVEITPLDARQYATTVMGGGTLYAVETRPGGGSRVRTPRRGSPGPTFDQNGAQNGVQRFHGEHAHPARAQRRVRLTPKAPSAPATPGEGRAGSRPPPAPVAVAPAPARPSRAARVTAHLSDQRPRRPFRCAVCDKLLVHPDSFVGIECGEYQWAAHEECD